jgi:hypothetical protein
MMMTNERGTWRYLALSARGLAAALAIFAGGSLGVVRAEARVLFEPAAAVAPAAEARANYTRTRDDQAGGKVMLELAIRTLKRVDGTGPDVHLVSAVHIADGAFYGAMQTFLNSQEVVLYEGVRPSGSDAIATGATNEERAGVTRDRMKLLASLAARAHAKTGEWSQTLEQVFESEPRLGKVLAGMKLDGWNHPIMLRVNPAPTDRDGSPIGESSITLVSLGSDSKVGGEAGASDIEQNVTARTGGAAAKDPKNMQQQLADALGLEFQLDRMDTTGKAWRNSDMAVDEVQRRLKKAGAESETLLAMLDGSSPMAKLAGVLLGFVKMSPQMRTMTTVMMIEVLGTADTEMSTPPASDATPKNEDGTAKPAKKRAGGMMGGMEQLRPMMQVILHDRNEVVAKDLKNIIATEPNVKSIAAFYGAAHLPDLEATLVKDLNLKLVNETWTPAITVDLKKAGASFAEVKQMRAMIQRQMRGK